MSPRHAGLGVSKSVITKRVKELEDRLKAQLLVRSTRRLTLTDAGASYFERCVRIVAELDEAQSAVRSLTVGLTGTLRVSCIASFLAHQLSRDMCRFQQQHPELIVELHHNDRIYDPIQEGYDICIQPSDIGGEDIIRQPIVAAAAAAGCGAGLFRAPRSAETSGRADFAPLCAQQLHPADRRSSRSTARMARCASRRSGRSCCRTASG